MTANSVEPEVDKISIYYLHDKSQKSSILLAGAMIAIITPFTDTIYLPALKNVATTLDASNAAVAATVSAYLAAVGVGQLIWGPLSDYYGRSIVLFWGLIIYEAFTIGCIFVTDINSLIILRTIEGLIVGSSIVTVQAIIADVFPEEDRGQAMGAFMTPMLVGPIIAPVIGGALAQAYNWRATFVLLAVMLVPILFIAVWLIPETHHYFVLKRVTKANAALGYVSTTTADPSLGKDGAQVAVLDTEGSSTSAVGVVDIESQAQITKPSKYLQIASTEVDMQAEPPAEQPITATTNASGPTVTASSFKATASGKIVHLHEADTIFRPPLLAPWAALAFLLDEQLAPSYCLICTSFAVMFVSLTTLPLQLAEAPYNLSASIVGLCYLPIGVGMFFGALYGGYSSDQSAVAYPKTPEGRLVYMQYTNYLVPAACIGFGVALHHGANLAAVLIPQAVLGFAQAIMMPSLMSYFSAAKPRDAAAAGGVMLFLCFAGAAVCISISLPIISAVGIQYFFVIIAGANFLSCLWSTYATLARIALP